MRQHWAILAQDLRLAVRLLRRNRGFAATAILTLALGIGGSTSIFSVVYAVVLQPLAFPESERVVRVGWVKQGGDASTVMRGATAADFAALRERMGPFELIGAARHDSVASPDKGNLNVPAQATSAGGGVGQSFYAPMMASASLFRIFGAATIIGRLPEDRDEVPGAPAVAVLSYSTWTTIYGRDPNVVGQRLTRFFGQGQKKDVTIVGVLAPDAFDHGGGVGMHRTPVWSSIDSDVLRQRDSTGRELLYLSIYARLAPGVSVEAARAQTAALTTHLLPTLPDHALIEKPSLDASRMRDQIVGQRRTPLLAFLGAVCCLLLVATANVTNLVLARSIARKQEFAARLALGARPTRIARQLLTESAVLALAGGALGMLVARWGRQAFVAISPAMPRLESSGIGSPAVIFGVGALLLATCLAGVTPALLASRRNVLDGLRIGGGAAGIGSRFSRPLAVLAGGEVALVLVLLAGTGLLVNSFARLVHFDLGFDARSVVMTTIERKVPVPYPPASRSEERVSVAQLSERARALRALDEEVVRRVAVLPGVQAAALTGDDPFGPPYRYSAGLTIPGAPPGADAALRLASPGALAALDLQLVAGRWFAESDREGAPYVAVINEAPARQVWAGRSPIGERVVAGRRIFEIVGMVRDVRDRGARQEVRPTFYASTTQLLPEPAMLVVRTLPGLGGIEPAITAELARMGDRINAWGTRRLRDIWWKQLGDARFLTVVLTVFSIVALTVAVVGVHGVLRFLVTQRTRELGIRKALGATQADLVRIVLAQALWFAVPGCLAGLAGAVAVAPGLRALLFGITPTDPLTLVLVTALLLAAVGAGAWLPARRASAVDPAISLRSE